LILHPEIVRRRERIDALRMELAALFDDYARITFEELPALRHRYNELFGSLERTTQERMLVLRQRKRMVELFAIKLDRGQALDAKMVELVMRAVMNENGELRSRMHRALRSRDASEGDHADGPRQRAGQSREIYRRLARRLHPDARGGADAVSRRYWDVVQQAYLRGDLEMLRALQHLVHEMGSGEPLQAQVFEAEEQRLFAAIAAERRRLGALRGSEPYTLADALYDDAWIAERHARHEAEIAEIEREIGACDRFLDPIFDSVRASGEPAEVASLWHDFVERMYLSGRY
jgi:hypothetical protein